MPFKSNFTALRLGERGLVIEGRTDDQELINSDNRLYVGVRPATSPSPELQVYQVTLVTEWSFDYAPAETSLLAVTPLTAVGVITRKNHPPVVWAEVIDKIEDMEDPLIDDDERRDDFVSE